MVKQYIKVERKTSDSCGWYEVMLSPFNNVEDAYNYIETYRNYYPVDQQNYRIKYDYSVVAT
jgi:hypothetical protein